MKPIRLAQDPFLGKAQSLGNGTAVRVVCRTGDHDFVQLMLLEGMLQHRATHLGHDTFPLHGRVEPIA